MTGNIDTRRSYCTRPQVQDVKSSSHKMPNVYNESDGHGFWPGAQRRHGRTLKQVLLQTLDITPCSGSTRILANSCNAAWRSLQTMTCQHSCLGPVYCKVTSARKKKEWIRNMQLDESESDDSDSGDAKVGEVSLETPTRIRERGEESEGTSDDGRCSSYAKGLEKNYEEIARLSELQPQKSLKGRQLE